MPFGEIESRLREGDGLERPPRVAEPCCLRRETVGDGVDQAEMLGPGQGVIRDRHDPVELGGEDERPRVLGGERNLGGGVQLVEALIDRAHDGDRFVRADIVVECLAEGPRRGHAPLLIPFLLGNGERCGRVLLRRVDLENGRSRPHGKNIELIILVRIATLDGQRTVGHCHHLLVRVQRFGAARGVE